MDNSNSSDHLEHDIDYELEDIEGLKAKDVARIFQSECCQKIIDDHHWSRRIEILSKQKALDK